MSTKIIEQINELRAKVDDFIELVYETSPYRPKINDYLYNKPVADNKLDYYAIRKEIEEKYILKKNENSHDNVYSNIEISNTNISAPSHARKQRESKVFDRKNHLSPLVFSPEKRQGKINKMTQVDILPQVGNISDIKIKKEKPKLPLQPLFEIDEKNLIRFNCTDHREHSHELRSVNFVKTNQPVPTTKKQISPSEDRYVNYPNKPENYNFHSKVIDYKNDYGYASNAKLPNEQFIDKTYNDIDINIDRRIRDLTKKNMLNKIDKWKEDRSFDLESTRFKFERNNRMVDTVFSDDGHCQVIRPPPSNNGIYVPHYKRNSARKAPTLAPEFEVNPYEKFFIAQRSANVGREINHTSCSNVIEDLLEKYLPEGSSGMRSNSMVYSESSDMIYYNIIDYSDSDRVRTHKGTSDLIRKYTKGCNVDKSESDANEYKKDTSKKSAGRSIISSDFSEGNNEFTIQKVGEQYETSSFISSKSTEAVSQRAGGSRSEPRNNESYSPNWRFDDKTLDIDSISDYGSPGTKKTCVDRDGDMYRISDHMSDDIHSDNNEREEHSNQMIIIKESEDGRSERKESSNYIKSTDDDIFGFEDLDASRSSNKPVPNSPGISNNSDGEIPEYETIDDEDMKTKRKSSLRSPIDMNSGRSMSSTIDDSFPELGNNSQIDMGLFEAEVYNEFSDISSSKASGSKKSKQIQNSEDINLGSANRKVRILNGSKGSASYSFDEQELQKQGDTQLKSDDTVPKQESETDSTKTSSDIALLLSVSTVSEIDHLSKIDDSIINDFS